MKHDQIKKSIRRPCKQSNKKRCTHSFLLLHFTYQEQQIVHMANDRPNLSDTAFSGFSGGHDSGNIPTVQLQFQY